MAVYSERTKRSQARDRTGKKVMPAGVPSSFQAYDPWPVVVQARRRVADGRRRRQRVHRLRHGLRRPVRRAHEPASCARRCIEQIDHGSLYVTPCELDAEVCELLAERYGLPMWRPTNSGTEATHDAIRLARGVTGRERIVKVEGGYHGHHDEVMISNKPPLDKAGPADRPTPVAELAGDHQAGRRGRHGDPLQRPGRARAGAAGRRRGLLHRRAGDAEHRHLPARPRLPVGGARDHRAVRHAADLRRGQDRHHRRVRRRQRALRRHTRPDHARQVDRRRVPGRRLRRQGRVHEPDQPTAGCCTSAPTTATRW